MFHMIIFFMKLGNDDNFLAQTTDIYDFPNIKVRFFSQNILYFGKLGIIWKNKICSSILKMTYFCLLLEAMNVWSSLSDGFLNLHFLLLAHHLIERDGPHSKARYFQFKTLQHISNFIFLYQRCLKQVKYMNFNLIHDESALPLSSKATKK